MAFPARISLITLGTRDVSATTAFYRRLGFELSDASVQDEVSFFRTGGAVLALWGVDVLADDARLPRPGGLGTQSTAFAVNVDSRDEVDAALAAAERAGGRITRPAEATDWGGYNGYFADPDGHVWEVAHNPFWPLDDRGLPQLP